MWLTDSKYEEIKAEIAYLLKTYGICHLPIIGFELAAKMGIILRPYSSLSEKKRLRVMELSEDGFYFEPGDGTECIYYNDKKSYERQNWTMLHEIGHCASGHTADMDVDEAEAEANFFDYRQKRIIAGLTLSLNQMVSSMKCVFMTKITILFGK